jgi:hypothetical protein
VAGRAGNSLNGSRASVTSSPTGYSPKCLEGEFCEVRLYGVLGSCAMLPSQVGYSNACYVGLGPSSPLRPTEEAAKGR